MNKLFTLIALGVIIVFGLILLIFDQFSLGFPVSISGVILLSIVLVLEPSDSRKTVAKHEQAKEAPVAPLRPHPGTAPKPVVETPKTSLPPEKQDLPKPIIPPRQDERTTDKPEETSAREAQLLREIADLTQLVERKTRESETLAAKLKDRRDIKLLQRVAQFQIALEFNRKMMAAGKMDEAKALREVELELEAALDELGIRPYPIEAGVKLRELPNGSFELLKAEAPESPELAGTVKAIHQSAMTYKDADGHTHFLIPAKIDAHKLS